MRSFVASALGGIIRGFLGLNSESKFIIKCPKCECVVELEDGFYEGSGDIEVTKGDGISENVVTISCNKCGNRIVSSEY